MLLDGEATRSHVISPSMFFAFFPYPLNEKNATGKPSAGQVGISKGLHRCAQYCMYKAKHMHAYAFTRMHAHNPPSCSSPSLYAAGVGLDLEWEWARLFWRTDLLLLQLCAPSHDVTGKLYHVLSALCNAGAQLRSKVRGDSS